MSTEEQKDTSSQTPADQEPNKGKIHKHSNKGKKNNDSKEKKDQGKDQGKGLEKKDQEQSQEKEKKKGKGKEQEKPKGSTSSPTLAPSVGITPIVDDSAEEDSLKSIELTVEDTSISSRPSAEVLQTLDRLLQMSEGNTVTKPEFVVLGAKGSGKTTLIEGLLEKPVLFPEQNIRPLTFHVNYRENSESLFVLRKDYSLREFSEDKSPTLSELPEFIKVRNKPTERYDPIILNVNSTSFYPAIIYDTISDSLETGKLEELCKPSQRFLFVVCNCTDLSTSKSFIDLAHRIDPTSSRTFYLYTHFNQVCRNFQSSRDATKFFSATENNSYYVTLPCMSFRINKTEAEILSIQQALSRRDKNILCSIQADTKYQHHVGLASFERLFSSLCWRHYQSQIPIGLQSLRKQILLAKTTRTTLNNELQELSSKSLRPLASKNTALYLTIVNHILKGTCEGNALINGQTLEEEQQRAGVTLSDELDLDDISKNIPNADKKLYGGQQFVRLLAEFKESSAHCPKVDTSLLNASSSSSNSPESSSNTIWAVADLARQHSQTVFMRLIENLLSRASYIANRIPNIVISIMEAHRVQNPDSDTLSVNFPYFFSRLGEYYKSYIETLESTTLNKCMDEFYSTKTLCWDLSNNSTILTEKKTPQENAQLLFDRISKRIVRNVLAKVYSFFITPLKTELWGILQGKVSELSDEELVDLFKKAENEKRYQEAIKALDAKIESLSQQEKKYNEDAGAFAYQKL